MLRLLSASERRNQSSHVSLLLGSLLVVGTVVPADAAIPTVERDALIALYNSTSGSEWTDRTNWRNAGDTDFNDAGTECRWYGVTCNGGETAVVLLDLYGNNLSGAIPPELGNLSALRWLFLQSNQLSGRIPQELGNLSNLRSLDLRINELSGSIPPELGNLTMLEILNLGGNQLSGTIPPELGDLSSLRGLALTFTQLSGSIPPELGNLSMLEALLLGSNQLSGEIPSGLQNLSLLMSADIGYNALWTDDPALQAFLHTKDPDWDQTQTIAPIDVAAISPTPQSVHLSWTPILYSADPGGYRVSYSTTRGGPYTYCGMTGDKLASGLTVEGLQSGTTHHFIVETQTDPHSMNQNTVISEPSAEVQATTQGAPIPELHPAGMVVLISILLAAGFWVLRSRYT